MNASRCPTRVAKEARVTTLPAVSAVNVRQVLLQMPMDSASMSTNARRTACVSSRVEMYRAPIHANVHLVSSPISTGTHALVSSLLSGVADDIDTVHFRRKRMRHTRDLWISSMF
jgi:hypothetical protein